MHNASGHSPGIMNHIIGREQSEEELNTPCLLHIKSSDINGSSDVLLNQQSYTSDTKMLPWPPKMATGQDFGKKAVNEINGAGGRREGFSLPHTQGWQGPPSIFHHPRATK